VLGAALLLGAVRQFRARPQGGIWAQISALALLSVAARAGLALTVDPALRR
jgi:hypothetical protein